MKHFLVTGASNGLGLALVKNLLGSGDNVSALARKAPDNIEGLKRENFQFLTADVTQKATLNTAVDQFVKKFGYFDAVVHCAGVYGPFGPTDRVHDEEWESTIRINLIGTYNVISASYNFVNPDGAKFIALSGGGATTPMPNISAYAASKAGVVRLIESVALEQKGSGRVFMALAPGLMATQMLDQVLAAQSEVVGEDFYSKMSEASRKGIDNTEDAVSCIKFLLESDITNLNGLLLSAVWDPWKEWEQLGSIPKLNPNQYTLRREI